MARFGTSASLVPVLWLWDTCVALCVKSHSGIAVWKPQSDPFLSPEILEPGQNVALTDPEEALHIQVSSNNQVIVVDDLWRWSVGNTIFTIQDISFDFGTRKCSLQKMTEAAMSLFGQKVGWFNSVPA